MLLYKFNNKIIDLSTFIEIKSINYNILLNEYKYFYTYQDFANYTDKDISVINTFLTQPFFKIYNKLNDFELFKTFFNEISDNNLLIKTYKFCEQFYNEIFCNGAVKSFYNYNLLFRKFAYSKNNDWLINWDKDFFNWKENYKTFRISNSFVNLSNDDILTHIKIEPDESIIELDIKASDWLLLILFNFFYTNNKNFSSKLKQIKENGVYNSVDALNTLTYKDRKKELLISIYSLTSNSVLNDEQKNIIKELDLDNLLLYFNSNEKINLPNGFERTVDNKFAYVGQTLTSILLRFIILSLSNYNILFSKHDSVFIKLKTVDINKMQNDFYINLENIYFNWCGKDILISKQQEQLFNVILKNNIKFSKLI